MWLFGNSISLTLFHRGDPSESTMLPRVCTPPLSLRPERRPASAMVPIPGNLALSRGRGGTSRRQLAERIRSARIRGEEIRLQSGQHWHAECIVVAFAVCVR